MSRQAVTRLLNLFGMIVVGGVLVIGLSEGRGAPSIYVFMLVNFGVTYRVLGPRPKWPRLAMFTNSAVGLLGSALAVALYQTYEQRGIPIEEARLYFGVAAASFAIVVLNIWCLLERGLARSGQPSATAPEPESPSQDPPTDEPDRER